MSNYGHDTLPIGAEFIPEFVSLFARNAAAPIEG